MSIRVMTVTGYRPAQEKEVTRFLQALDVLGANEEIMVAFCHKLTLTLKPGVTPDQMGRQTAAILDAYRALGCINVEVRG